MKWFKFKGQAEIKYVIFFLIAISIAKGLEAYIRTYWGVSQPSATLENMFAANFIEWFGVLYGILLPLILVRVWEQLDDIDREFDREADTIRIFYDDLSFLRGVSENTKGEIAVFLREYIRHVVKKYPYEVKKIEKRKGTVPKILMRIREWIIEVIDSRAAKEPENERKIGLNILIKIRDKFRNSPDADKGKKFEEERKAGDRILQKIREKLGRLIHPNVMKRKDSEFLVKELFQRLNDIIDIRGDRIGFASQRLFDTLRLVALITSIVFLVPFYIIGFSIELTLIDDILIVGVTVLVIFIYMIIEDFDEPFGGTWKIDDESWIRTRRDIICKEREFRLENRVKKETLPKSQKPRKVGSSHSKRQSIARKSSAQT